VREASRVTPEAWSKKTKGERSRLKCGLVSYRSLAIVLSRAKIAWVRTSVNCNATRTDGCAAGCIRAAHRI